MHRGVSLMPVYMIQAGGRGASAGVVARMVTAFRLFAAAAFLAGLIVGCSIVCDEMGLFQ